MARRHIAYYRQADPDILKVMNDTGYAPLDDFYVTEPSDWARLRPTPLSDAHFQSHLEGLKAIVRELGREVLIMTTAFNPFHEVVAILRHSLTPEEASEEAARRLFVHHARTQPEPLLAALQVMAEDLACFYRACVCEAGIAGIYYSAQGGERELMTDAEHARFVAPFDMHILNGLRGVAEVVVGHFCGRALNLHRFVDYPVQVANWAHQSGNMSLGEGRMLFRGITVLGGLDERGPLVYGPREALRREVEATLRQMGTRGFILGAGCTVPSDVDVGNLVYARSLLAD